jgi:hypothetical protein
MKAGFTFFWQSEASIDAPYLDHKTRPQEGAFVMV